MIKVVVTVALIGLLAGCQVPARTKVKIQGEPDIEYVDTEDKEVNEAILQAIRTLGEFKKALRSNNHRYSDFALKVAFKTNDGREHIWLNEIKLKGDDYYGIVNNTPDATTEVKLGDTIKVNLLNVSDWMYVDKDTLRGGYTIKVFFDDMSDQEKKEFLSETGYIIPK